MAAATGPAISEFMPGAVTANPGAVDGSSVASALVWYALHESEAGQQIEHAFGARPTGGERADAIHVRIPIDEQTRSLPREKAPGVPR
jgi:hypothetical protein